ncbi:flavodoxin [Bacillus piscicola]|uniref:flavodoxin n=1 Tax=Bacillus piscicola TaxID=1632684 RepID=UPI001F0894BD|nr:flavodoxin [Bacillus piscicola]
MGNICIVYASMTGNTEEIKDILASTLNTAAEADVYMMDNTEAEIIEDYDYILLGSYTYDDGDIPFEAEDFYEELENMDLTGKNFACFGSGDTLYVDFCNAAVLFEERVQEQGGKIMEPVLKVELSPHDEDQKEKCLKFAENVLHFIAADKIKN